MASMAATTMSWEEENVTVSSPVQQQTMEKMYKILVPAIMCVIMLAMGCGITLSEVKKHVRQPRPLIIGMMSQFVLMPAAAFGLAHALLLSNHHAIGMMLTSGCPGGAVSNIFTFWSRGDLALSISMTMASTILALGFMPLNMFIYLRPWTDSKAHLPFASMAISIALTWLPVLIGCAIRYKAERAAHHIVRVGSVAGIVLIASAGVIQSWLHPEFFHLPWNVWIGAFGLPLLGFGMGFTMASAACLPVRMKRTIAYETGLQNVGLALAIITLSFPPSVSGLYSQFPLLFAGGQMVTAVTSVIIHNIVFYIRSRQSRNSDGDQDKDIKEVKEINGLLLGAPVEEVVQIETCFDGKPQHTTTCYNEPVAHQT